MVMMKIRKFQSLLSKFRKRKKICRFRKERFWKIDLVTFDCWFSHFVAFKDLNKEVEENGKNLSGGQIQRICLARALYQDKKILLIDEGFSAIDVKKADEIERKVLAIKELTIINVTHHLSERNEAYYDEKLVLSGIGLD